MQFSPDLQEGSAAPAARPLTARAWIRPAATALILLALGLWNLDGPPMWWDEGWTLSVARTWVERGHYGRLMLGELAPGGLEASPTTTAPVGLTMRLLGVGLWQGRLFGVLCAVAALLALAALGRRLYGDGLWWPTLAVALLLTGHPQIHPLLQGRQVLAEMPMLAYLLLGYLLLWGALAGRLALLAPAALLLGLAWIAKGQTAPFLLASLLAPLLAAALARRWRVALIFALACAGAYASSRGLPRLIGAILINPAITGPGVTGLLEVLAFVLTPFNRAFAARQLLIFGLPTVLGTLWAVRMLWRERAAAGAGDDAAARWYMTLALVALVATWTGWFVALSVGVPRYLAPPVVVGALFVAALLRDVTGNFSPGRTLADLVGALRPARGGWRSVGTLLTVLLVAGSFALTALGLARSYPERDPSAAQAAAWLNAQPPGSVVETYESELHFLLEQPYHYPPDQLHVELNRRSLLGQEVAVDYDPLAADPEFLVVGRFARGNDLYEPILAAGAFAPAQRFGPYEIYRRVR
jgi:hypothetical protein